MNEIIRSFKISWLNIYFFISGNLHRCALYRTDYETLRRLLWCRDFKMFIWSKNWNLKIQRLSERMQNTIAKANEVAEEVLSTMRTIRLIFNRLLFLLLYLFEIFCLWEARSHSVQWSSQQDAGCEQKKVGSRFLFQTFGFQIWDSKCSGLNLFC